MDVLQEKVGPNDPKFLPLGLFGTRGVSKKFELIWLLEKLGWDKMPKRCHIGMVIQKWLCQKDMV